MSVKNTAYGARKKSLSYEELAFKTDDELRKLFINLRSVINKSRRKKSSTRQLEIELCYIQKEMQDRKEYRKKK